MALSLVHFGLISQTEVLEFLKTRPSHVDLIMTGPQIPQVILDVADQITEICRSHQPKKVNHRSPTSWRSRVSG
ncbi:MAG: cob(I)yrinic acid a,c-diamide adenosyltransferase [Potamolinea sp.]